MGQSTSMAGGRQAMTGRKVSGKARVSPVTRAWERRATSTAASVGRHAGAMNASWHVSRSSPSRFRAVVSSRANSPAVAGLAFALAVNRPISARNRLCGSLSTRYTLACMPPGQG